MANWAELPYDLIALIARRVKVMEHFIAFGAVCTSWQAAATKDNFDVLLPQVPLLMLDNKEDDFREFYSLTKEKVSRIFLPGVRGRLCYSSKGWLFFASDSTEKMTMLHPFSGSQIQLPPRKASRDYEDVDEGSIYKVVLSVSPTITSDYALIIHYYDDDTRECVMAFWRPGDLNWTKIDTEIWGGVTSDIIYYKGKFYIVSHSGQVWGFEVAGPSIPRPIIEPRLLVEEKEDSGFLNKYLVEVSGALLLVNQFIRYLSSAFKETLKFEVFEVDVIEGVLKETNTLGESAIFLSHHETSSIDSSKSAGVKPNHIYFFEYNGSISAYNVADGSIVHVSPKLPVSCIIDPTWITPSF